MKSESDSQIIPPDRGIQVGTITPFPLPPAFWKKTNTF
jgi:hypothetical protein